VTDECPADTPIPVNAAPDQNGHSEEDRPAARPALSWPIRELPPGSGSAAVSGGDDASPMVDRRVLILVDGELDVLTSPRLRQQVGALIDDGAQVIVLDLAGVTFMDSSALGALVSCLKRAQSAGAKLRLSALRPRQTHLMTLTGLSTVFSVYATTDEATGLDAKDLP
jgi:anti-sigma B factor antagonist